MTKAPLVADAPCRAFFSAKLWLVFRLLYDFKYVLTAGWVGVRISMEINVRVDGRRGRRWCCSIV